MPDDVHARAVGDGPDLGLHRLGGVLGQPAAHLAGLEHRAAQLEAALGFELLGRQRLEQPIAQHPELQPVEQGVGRLAVPGATLHVVHGHRKVEVADQRVDPAVPQHVLGACLERLGRLALELAGVGDEILQAVVGLQPLGGGLRTDAGHARQVVAGLPDQGSQLGIARRGGEVLLLHRRRSHPAEVGHPLARVEHGHVLGHELEGVPVAGADQHVEASLLGLGGQRADHVVGLEALLLARARC